MEGLLLIVCGLALSGVMAWLDRKYISNTERGSQWLVLEAIRRSRVQRRRPW